MTDPRLHKNLLERLLRRIRLRLRQRHAINAIAVGILAWALLQVLGLTLARAAAMAAGLAVVVFTFLSRRELRKLDATALNRHLDRRYPELEESAALLGRDPGELTPLQALQRRRISDRLEPSLANGSWLPTLNSRVPLAIMALGLALGFAAPAINAWLNSERTGSVIDATVMSPNLAELTSAEVMIRPPAYSGIPETSTNSLDLKLLSGSDVEWTLEFSRPGGRYALAWPDGDLIELEDLGTGRYRYASRVDTTSLYRVVELTAGDPRALEGVYTIAAQLDRKPDIRVLQPADTALEIARDGSPQFSSEVRITDDFGLGEVQILASVGRGGGEGVKFRDQTLAFSEREGRDQDEGAGEIFRRDWNLADLGMEPGDEVYFFVTALDNREPEPNQARSRTVVVRWLDEETVEAEFAGLAIDIMPEYFKGQRQIIVETEQLIADREELDDETFETTSRALAQAQGDLKQRYGQYLGDEAEEGAVFDPPPEALVHDSDEDHDGHDEEDEESHREERDALAHVDHDHGAEAAAAANIDLSGGAQELIARFLHDHGAADIGPITSRNPVGLMKRSLANMWQAELHLHLSEPGKALPFEYEALKYFNLARQAERIYTRRLGFEPPPVSEERRLTGELGEIFEYSRRESARPDPSDTQLFREAWQMLSTGLGRTIGPDQRASLENLRLRLTDLSQQRPALIRHAATVERLLLAGEFNLPDCEGCLDSLIDATWSLLPSAGSEPSPGSRMLDLDDPLVREFMDQVSP